MSAQRPPDYVLKVKTKDGKEGRVGACWVSEKGYVNVILDCCVVLDASKIELLTMFPKDRKR